MIATLSVLCLSGYNKISIYRLIVCMSRKFDVIVVGCGHAGCEAAAASARLGCDTLLIGLNLESIALMPCNPAIGGPAKSHLVKEIDALGGIMGLAADATYLQLKTLNASKGAAVHALRAQSDKYEYSFWVRDYLNAIATLKMYQAMVSEILIEGNRAVGVRTSIGEEIRASAVILTGGTFLQGKVFIGKNSSSPSGRAAEPAATGLTPHLQRYGFEFGRLKTGTPPRLDRRSINFESLSVHTGDTEAKYFSFLSDRPQERPQYPCHSTRTTSKTHDLILDNLNQSPLYANLIEGIGPRYCPSIEDKVVRFRDKESHLLFLEPESLRSSEIYLQGFSTSFPVELQWQMLRSLPGLEAAEIIRPAYAVEYDFLKPSQFEATLQSRALKGFFAAGQLLGTSGYEEAAAQGLVAGINAARQVQQLEPVIFAREESYLATLIDDLIVKDITEPYRMMTSRSEYRLYLRQDNADQRLTPLGREIGLVDENRWLQFQQKMQNYQQEIHTLKNHKFHQKNNALTLYDFLARPEVEYSQIDQILKRNPQHTSGIPRFEVETEIKYAGYVKKQKLQAQKLHDLSHKKIPTNIDYLSITHLSKEAQEKLIQLKPKTIGELQTIDGVRQADISLLLVSLAKADKLAD